MNLLAAMCWLSREATEDTRYDGGIAMTEDKVTPQRIMPDSRLRGNDGRRPTGPIAITLNPG